MKSFYLRFFLLGILAFLGTGFSFGQTTIYTQDFETLNSGYTSSTTSGSGDTDVFNRVNPNLGGNSTFIWAAEDISTSPSTITLDQIDVTGYSDFTFFIDLIAKHYNDWDDSDEMNITYSLDGGPQQNLLSVQATNAPTGSNEPAALDLDFNGIGNCPAAIASLVVGSANDGNCNISTSGQNVPTVFTTYSSPTILLNSNSTLDIEIEFINLESNDEGIYLDDIEVTANSSGGSCLVTSLSLANVACDDNSTTADASDDFITFDLNPTGSNLGASYNVTVSSGTVSPTSGTYGSSTSFSLNTGSAGGGNVDVTITDVDDATCSATETITDPGSCSSGGGGSSTCGVEIDFETQGDGYTTSDNSNNPLTEFSDGSGDYFTQTDGSNISSGVSFGNTDGSFFAAQDIDGEGATLPVELNITNINISTLSNLEFSIDLAEDDDGSNQDWDDADYMRIYYTIDSGTEQNLLWVESELSSGNNGKPLIDTDFDGVGDGTEITDAFTTFTESIASTGSLMDIRIEFSLDSGDEDIAIDNIKVCGTPASSNDSDSDIVTTNFNPSDNIDYTLYNASSGLTTLNAIKVGEFEIRDGGATNDADAVGTILTDLDLDITNFDNLAAIALFDGSTNISEVTTPMATTSFLSINSGSGITANDDDTKTFEVYVTFNSTVTDNEQVVLNISSAVADGANGSVFSAIDAGGASTPNVGDDNRIEVTATDLIFDQNATDVEVSTVMSPSPTVIAVDANVNTDLDYTASVSLGVSTTNFDASATTVVNAVDGVATFSNLIFDNTSTGSILTASAGALNDDTSSAFNVFTAPITIAIEDFDGTSPSWPNDISDQTFIDPSTSSEGFFIQPSTNIGSGNTAYGDDMGGETGEPTLSPYTFTFEEINVADFSNLVLSFDYYAFANADSGSYEIFIDGLGQGSVEFYNDPDTTPDQGTITENIGTANTISLVLTGTLNGGGDIIELDNFKIEGNYDGDLVYSGGTWTPSAPTASTGTEDALVQDGTYITSGDVNLNSITVLGDAFAEISFTDVITINEGIYNNGTLTFKSDFDNVNSVPKSAQLADATGITVTGDVTVERYIPANRAFRLLSSPVTTTDFILENWQQNGLNPLDQGYEANVGFQITGGGTPFNPSLGFDESGTNNPSMFTFDNTNDDGDGDQTNDWKELQNTNATKLNAGEPYLTMVRGDRSTNLFDASLAMPSVTTLKATGDLQTGTVTYDAAGTGANYLKLSDEDDFFSLVANPYQAVVDYSETIRNGLTDFIYVWDAKIAGDNGNGGYVTVKVSTGEIEPPSPSSSNASEFIAPGMSFFVENDNDNTTTSQITFEEADKATAENQVDVFNTYPHFYINSRLYTAAGLQNGDTENDAIGLRFSSNYTTPGNSNEDSSKLFNPGENYAVVNNGLRSLDYQDIPQIGHEIDLSITNYQNTNYSLTFFMENKPTGLGVFILDSYLNTQTELTGNFVYDFTVDANIPESIAGDRFSLVFDNTTLGIDENSFGTNFSLYPNPSGNGQFSIKTPQLSGDVQVEISNLLGQQVSSQQLSIEGQQVKVNAENLTTGIYVVKLSQDGQSFSAKLMID